MAVAAALSWQSVQWSRTIVVLLSTLTVSLVFVCWLVWAPGDAFEAMNSYWYGSSQQEHWATPGKLLAGFRMGALSVGCRVGA